MGNLSSAILFTWPYHVSWFCSISFIIGSSKPICCLIILSFLDILEDLLRATNIYYYSQIVRKTASVKTSFCFQGAAFMLSSTNGIFKHPGLQYTTRISLPPPPWRWSWPPLTGFRDHTHWTHATR